MPVAHGFADYMSGQKHGWDARSQATTRSAGAVWAAGSWTVRFSLRWLSWRSSMRSAALPIVATAAVGIGRSAVADELTATRPRGWRSGWARRPADRDERYRLSHCAAVFARCSWRARRPKEATRRPGLAARRARRCRASSGQANAVWDERASAEIAALHDLHGNNGGPQKLSAPSLVPYGGQCGWYKS